MSKEKKYINLSFGGGIVLIFAGGALGDLQLATLGALCWVFGFGVVAGISAAKDD